MKLRIRGNSIRLRLTQSEVQSLAEKGIVEESTHFGGDKALNYAIMAVDVAHPIAHFNDGDLHIHLPKEIADHWAQSDEIGIEHTQPLEEGDLRILIEKDFACLTDRVGEDESDAFPNPNLTC